MDQDLTTRLTNIAAYAVTAIASLAVLGVGLVVFGILLGVAVRLFLLISGL